MQDSKTISYNKVNMVTYYIIMNLLHIIKFTSVTIMNLHEKFRSYYQ